MNLQHRIQLGLTLVIALPFLHCAAQKVKTPQQLQQEAACIENIQKGDYDRAETRCEICLEYSSRSEECLNGLGIIWYVRGVEDKARGYFQKAIRENNDFAQAWNNVGTLDFVNKDFEDASYNFERSIEIDPRYLDGRYNLALSYLRMGQLRKASAYQVESERVLDAGKQLDPTKVWFNISDSDRDYIFAKYLRAETEYRKLFELYPNHVNSYRDMGVLMTHRGEMQLIDEKRNNHISDAEQFFKRCLDLEPAMEDCHESIAHLFLAVGRFDESLYHYVQCLSSNKNNPVCGNEIKLAYEGSKLKGESMQEYIKQIAENPGFAPAHYGFCLSLFDEGMTEMGVTECENALRLDADQCLAHYQLALHYKRVLDRDLTLFHARGLLTCAKDAPKYSSEITQCKEIVNELEAS